MDERLQKGQGIKFSRWSACYIIIIENLFSVYLQLYNNNHIELPFMELTEKNWHV